MILARVFVPLIVIALINSQAAFAVEGDSINSRAGSRYDARLMGAVTVNSLLKEQPVENNGQYSPAKSVMGDEDYYYTINENDYLTFTKTYGDNTYDTYCISAPRLPNGATMPTVEGDGPQTSTFDWTPTYCQGGGDMYIFDINYYNVGLDPNPEWIGTAKITVNNVNRAPQITSQVPEAANVKVGGNFHLDITATDADMVECQDDALTMSYSSSPVALAVLSDLGSGSATFDWTPEASEIGMHTITFSATDQYQGSDLKQMQVRVYLCGDANNDQSVNVGDAVYQINYVFKGGPAPDPLEAGDANCDETINVGDAVHIINYIFKGGAEPCCP